MGKPRVMIRGIYATALTRSLTDMGFLISQPSAAMTERFDLKRTHEWDVTVVDRPDRQGIRVEGEAEMAECVVLSLLKALPDMIVREVYIPDLMQKERTGRFRLQAGYLLFDVEFPYGCKTYLDDVRSQVVPTIKNHHLLKTVDPETVDVYEAMLRSDPERRDELSSLAQKNLVYQRLRAGGILQIHHVKPNGSIVRLSDARILRFEDGTLSLQRRIVGDGKYDGLDVKKTGTDYAVTLAEEGSPTLKHSYFSYGGGLKGEFYNVNTPVEFYPDKIRYVDLEVDVVRRPGEKPQIVDSDKLDQAVERSYISLRLAQAAKEIARKLVVELSGD
ncbi:DUF402 domain-containing protein [Candidatus Bathyarchaeota archaeon]|nr:DUF402 domain-containing protein [Candidatus Bathyarchaeota archaeon]